MWKVLAILVVLRGVAHADDPLPSDGRVLGEAAVGALGTIGGGLAGLLVGSAVAPQWDDGRDRDEAIVISTMTVGAVFGATGGVFLVGHTDKQTASFGGTLGGAAVGTAVGFGGAYLISRDGNYHGAAGLVVIACPAIGATVGFALTRKSRIAPVVTPQSVGVAGTF